jgi:hypothetical protein
MASQQKEDAHEISLIGHDKQRKNHIGGVAEGRSS